MGSGDVRASPGGIGVSIGDIEAISLMVSSEPLELVESCEKRLILLLAFDNPGWVDRLIARCVYDSTDGGVPGRCYDYLRGQTVQCAILLVP